MKISTSFKHKPVVVSENDEHLDGRLARNTDVKGLSLGLLNGTERGEPAFLPRYGEARETKGHGHRRNCLSIAFLICPF